MSDVAAQDAWVKDVFGLEVHRGPGGSGGEGGQPDGKDKGGLVAYRKMLLRWRGAQASLDAGLQSVGKTLLSLPEVKDDPRFKEIERAVGALPKLVPKFGGQLEDVLDAGLNATEPAEQARLSKEGVAAIDAYRKTLAGAKPLLDLEQFAAKNLGGAVELHGALDQALQELRAELAA